MAKLPFVVEPAVAKVQVGPDDCKVELTRRGKIDALEKAWFDGETERYSNSILPVDVALENPEFAKAAVDAYASAIADAAKAPGERRLIAAYLSDEDRAQIGEYPEVFSAGVNYAEKAILFNYYAAAATIARFRLGQSEIGVWDMQGWVGDYGSDFVGSLANFYRCELNGLPWVNESMAQPKEAKELAGTDVPVAAQGELL